MSPPCSARGEKTHVPRGKGGQTGGGGSVAIGPRRPWRSGTGCYGAQVPAQETSALTLSLVAGGFTTFGVLAKIAYDSIAARRNRREQGLERFADDRRAAYDDFLNAVERQRAYGQSLRRLLDRVRSGETEITEEERKAFPDSPMADLIAALDQVRRLARNYSVITSAEAIVQLFGDMAGALRAALEEPRSNDEITWFLLQRFLEDRCREFVHGYREDLGLGHPSGAPKRWPIVERNRLVSLEDSERIVRAHIPRKDRLRTSDPGGPDTCI
jgi:hypothetical protein